MVLWSGCHYVLWLYEENKNYWEIHMGLEVFISNWDYGGLLWSEVYSRESVWVHFYLFVCLYDYCQTKTSRALKIFKYVSRCHVPIDVISEWPLRDTWRRNIASKFSIYKNFTFLFSWILKKLSNIMISVTNQLFNANSNNKK